MDSNLVHPAGVWLCLKQREAGGRWGGGAESGERAEGCLRGATFGMNALLKPYARGTVQALSQKRRLKFPGILLRPAKDQRGVGFADGARLHLTAEVACRRLGFGNQSQAAGFPVQAVDDGNSTTCYTFEGK